MVRYFISDIYCPASLVTMARILLGNVSDTYKHAVINEDDIPVLMEWLEKRQQDVLGKNRRVKAARIILYKPHGDDIHRYINVGDGHVTLIRVNERFITNKSI